MTKDSDNKFEYTFKTPQLYTEDYDFNLTFCSSLFSFFPRNLQRPFPTKMTKISLCVSAAF